MQEPSLDEYRTLLHRKLRRRRKSGLKRLEKLGKELGKAENWHLLEREALVLQANLYRIESHASLITLIDWETDKELVITLDPKLPPAEQIRERIKRSKKQRLSIPHLTEQIKQAEEFLIAVDQALERVECLETVEELEAIENSFNLKTAPKEKKSEQLTLPFKEYQSSTGVKIWVGKSAKDNDALTFSYANGLDWWLHVSEYSGSHVVIKQSKGEPDSETVKDAMQLAIGNSKAPKRGTVEVILTQVKYLKKFKGAKAGAVHLSKKRELLAEFDKQRYDSILRLLP